jgi:hypothetical protein
VPKAPGDTALSQGEDASTYEEDGVCVSLTGYRSQEGSSP